MKCPPKGTFMPVRTKPRTGLLHVNLLPATVIRWPHGMTHPRKVLPLEPSPHSKLTAPVR